MRRRARTLLLSGFLSTVAGIAAFADGPPSLKDTLVAPAVPTWSGMYFGGSIGYGWNDSTNRYRDSAGEQSSRGEHAEGGLVSAIWGFDRMIGNRFVIGGFVDFDWSDIERGRTGDGLTIDQSFAIGARVGALVTPSTLLFLTGGYTRARFDNDGWWSFVDTTDPSLSILRGRGSANFGGYFIGGGLERRISDNFYLRGEVRYAKYHAEVSNSGVAFDGTVFVDEEEPDIVTARLGLVYKMGRNEHGHGTKEDGRDDQLKVISYAGIDVAKNIWTVYSGGLMALNGDLTRNGLVARTFGWYANVDGSTGDAKDRATDVMLGYLHYFGSVSAIGYVGMEVRDVKSTTPGVVTPYKETETGFKVALEVESGDKDPFYFAFDGSYSTAFDTFYGQLRLGYNRKGTKFGPEGEIWKETGDLTSRLGGFLAFPVNLAPNLPAELSLSSGYQWVKDDNTTTGGNPLSGIRGGEGAYFNSTFKVTF
jgi:opacity protein-like surface antigen